MKNLALNRLFIPAQVGVTVSLTELLGPAFGRDWFELYHWLQCDENLDAAFCHTSLHATKKTLYLAKT